MSRTDDFDRPDVSVVIATRDRRDQLMTTLRHLRDLPDAPPVIVVDNGSSDGTVAAVTAAHPEARVIEADCNLGAPARNLGVAAATTELVAFADDDSWWAPGALGRAAAHFAAAPTLAVLQGRILVGPEEVLDPTCAAMGRSPLPRHPGLPGPSILGFVACGSVVRCDPFLLVGGFDTLLHFLGEEELVSLDLASEGWELAYADDVVAHHHPSPRRPSGARRTRQMRNALLTTWMRRPPSVVARRTAQMARRSMTDPRARRALAEATVRVSGALQRRRSISPGVESLVRSLEREAVGSHA